MSHTSVLRMLNIVYAVFAFLGSAALSLVTVLVAVGFFSLGHAAGATAPNPEFLRLFSFAGGGMVAAVFGAMAVGLALIGALHLWVGALVMHGRGRIVQTVLAILSLGNMPIGLAYGLYALWVCWANEPTKRLFERNNVLSV